MAYAEKRGKGPHPWRVKYKIPGGEESQSGFETKRAALEWGRDQEAKIRAGTWTNPTAGELTVKEWIVRWQEQQDVGPRTTVNREYLFRRFIQPHWGAWPLNSITGADVSIWEKKLPAAENVSRSTAKDARALLHTILGDAAAARPPLIPYNPAVRQRNRGRRTGRRLQWTPQRAWATPLQVLLLAERAALMGGRDDEFTMLVTIAYTGMRWGETIGLESDHLLPGLINVEWQLQEITGRFHRLPPKDDSYRSTNWQPLLPVDLPPSLDALLSAQARKHAQRRCPCATGHDGQEGHDGTGRYVFLGPDGGHHRNSNYARRVFRPACDGRHPPTNGKPGRLVITDATAWPGIPIASWPEAVPGKPFAPPSGRGTPRLVNTDSTGRCPDCGHAVSLRLDGKTIAHNISTGTGTGQHCPGSGEPPAKDAPLASWLPIKEKLTPHGLRHSHKTWMAEDGIPEILAEQRLGHQVPGMRGLYAHASERMRDDLTKALQARWEESLKQRAALAPHSPVPLIDHLLAQTHAGAPESTGSRDSSQISPSKTKAPIHNVG